MKKYIAFIFAALFAAGVWAEVSVNGVAAQQRYPWDGKVDIEVQLSGTAEELSKYVCTFAATNVATKAELATAHIEKIGEDTGSGESWTRHFVWDAKADVGAVKIDDIELTVNVVKDLGGVQLWENGPYFAECNVGASKPEEYGYYFWWGDTVGYKRNTANNGWVSVADGASFIFSSGNCPTYGKSISELQSFGYVDANGNLTAAHDAATTHLGAPWRMPTDAEFAALLNNCDTEWTTRSGVYGRLVKGRGAYASKSIFLPTAGYGEGSGITNYTIAGCYWSSTPEAEDTCCAWWLDFYERGIACSDNYYRNCGQSVRPVRGSIGTGVVDATGIGVSTSFSLGGEVDGFEVDLTGRIIGVIGDCPETITIPSWATGIADDVFKGATNLKHLLVESLDWVKGGAIEPKDGTQWFADGEYEGKTVYVNNDINDSESTSIEFSIPDGIDSISFAWKVSSEQNYDYLRWYLDGNERGGISGSQNWTTITEPLSSGEHTLRFTYSKDGSVSNGSDCGWIAILTEGGAGIEEIFADCLITEITLNESGGKVNGSIFKAVPTIEKINVPSKEWWLENAPTSNNPVAKGTASLWVNGENVDMYYIEYDANGGVGEMPRSYMTGGVNVVSDCTYVKDGCSFVGWKYADGERVEVFPGESMSLANFEGEEKITLYAVWGMDYNRVIEGAAEKIEKSGNVELVGYEGIGQNGENGLIWCIRPTRMYNEEYGYDYYGMPEGEITFTVEGEGYFSFDYKTQYESSNDWGWGWVDFEVKLDGSWFVEGAQNRNGIYTDYWKNEWDSRRYYIPAGTHTVTIAIDEGGMDQNTICNFILSNFRKETYAAPENIIEFAHLLADQGVWAEGKPAEFAAELEKKAMTSEERLIHAVVTVAQAFEDETLRAILPRFGYSASYMPLMVVPDKDKLGDEPIKLDDIPLSNDVVDAMFAAVEPKLKVALQDLAAIPDRNKVKLDHVKYEVLDEDIHVDLADRKFLKASIEGMLGLLNYVKAQNFEVDYDSALNAATNTPAIVIEPNRPKMIRNTSLGDNHLAPYAKLSLDEDDFKIVIQKGRDYVEPEEGVNVYRGLEMNFVVDGEEYEMYPSYGDYGYQQFHYWGDGHSGMLYGEIEDSDKEIKITIYLDYPYEDVVERMRDGFEITSLMFDVGSSRNDMYSWEWTEHLWYELNASMLEANKQFMTQTKVLDKVRFQENMVEAKNRILAAFDDALAANAAVTNRTDSNMHAIEYDLTDIEDLERIFAEIDRVKASLEGTAQTINLADYLEEDEEVPEFAGRNSVKVCLAALFDGVMPLRALIPESADKEVYAPYLDAIPDPTFGGLFPEETAESVRALALEFGLEDLKKNEIDPCNSPITWAQTLAEDGVWLPGKLDEFEKFYAAKDTDEAKIMHAAITLAKLGENETLRTEFAKFGYSLEDYTMNPIGELKNYADLPSANSTLDVIYSEAITALDAAIGGVNTIDDNWTGYVELKPEIYGLDETTYVDNGDVTLLKSALYSLRSIINLVAAYNYSDDNGDYAKIDSFYAEIDTNQVKAWLEALPDFAKARVMERFAASGADLKTALNLAKKTNELLKARSDDKLHFFEYDIADQTDVELVETYVDKLIAAIDGDTEIDLTAALERAEIEYDGEIPGGLKRVINLNPLFLGKIDRALLPEIDQEVGSREVMVKMDTLDPTMNGLLPMTMLVDWSYVLGFDNIVQHWKLNDYLKISPSVPLTGHHSKFIVTKDVKCAGEVSWTNNLAGEDVDVSFYDNGELVGDNPYAFAAGNHELRWVITSDEPQNEAITPLKDLALSLDGTVTIVPEDGAMLTGAFGSVLGTLTTEVEDARISYTLDGSEPTESSKTPLRGGKFPVEVAEGTHDGVYIKARAFLNGEALGRTSVSHVAYGRVENPVISSSLGTKFNHRGNVITISDATEGAMVYYTLDGSEPTVESMRYTQPFTIDEATTVKAIAVRNGYFDSAIVETVFEREYSAYDALDIENWEKVTIDNPDAWYIDWKNSYDGVASLRSPRIAEQTKTQFSIKVSGTGTLKFKWSVYCLTGWDYASYYVDGTLKKSIDCATDEYEGVWYSEVEELGAGEHTVTWEYYEYCGDVDYDECVWLDCVEWIPNTSVLDESEIVVIGPNEEPVKIETKDDKLVGKVTPGTKHEDIKIHVKGEGNKTFDTAKGYKITIAADGTFAAELKEPEYKKDVTTIFEDDGDGNITMQIEVVPGLFYGAVSSSTLSELMGLKIDLKQAQTPNDLPKAPKQNGPSGFYRVKVSNTPNDK